MGWDEISVPKELRPFMLEEVEETKLGQKNGACKQYRYGNLHIREFDDKYLVHMDKIDPRKDPLGHILVDAPEVLIGLTTAAIGGRKIASYIYKNHKNSKFAKHTSIFTGFLASIALGYAGYSITKFLKNF